MLEIIKNEVQKSDRQDLIVEFERLHKIFEAEGHISEIVRELNYENYVFTILFSDFG